ncbi:MAG: chromosomal replication initiator protein DnaA [Actinomycetota bacterium]
MVWKVMSVVPVQGAVETAWNHVSERLRSQLSETTYAMWFSGIRATDLREDTLELTVPSTYVRDWLTRNFLDLVRGAASEVVGRPIAIAFEIGEPLDEPVGRQQATLDEISPEPAPSLRSVVSDPLPFPDYTFETFVQGASNRFAHAAAMAVAEAQPSKAYNPLFVYGGVGLGKTHLLVAIGHHMQRLAPHRRAKYVTSEDFTKEFIRAVRERQGYRFAAQYRDVDVLLVDDIQFLAGREETLTEFFHTFNALHEKGRQIVIASDRPPQDLGMDDRLQSRFRLGLCVDIQPPDIETRIAILQLKAQRDQVVVPDDVVEYVASKFDRNIRELEGALVRVVAWSDLTSTPMSVELAAHALEDLLPQAVEEIPAALILEETARYFSLSVDDLTGKSRSRPLATARHVAMYLVRECTGMSLIKIGELFDRDHTTALHGITKIDGSMREREPIYRQVQDLSRIIRDRARGGVA